MERCVLDTRKRKNGIDDETESARWPWIEYGLVAAMIVIAVIVFLALLGPTGACACTYSNITLQNTLKR